MPNDKVKPVQPAIPKRPVVPMGPPSRFKEAEIVPTPVTIASVDDLVAQLQAAHDALDKINRASKYVHSYPLFFARMEQGDPDLKADAEKLVADGKSTRQEMRMRGFVPVVARLALADAKGALATAKELASVQLAKKS